MSRFKSKLTKLCNGCGATYSRSYSESYPDWAKRRFCSAGCASINRKQAPTPRQPQAQLIDRPCETCGGPVIAIRSCRRFCHGCAPKKRRNLEQRERDSEKRRTERATPEYKQKYRAWFLLKTYGLTVGQFNDMLSNQGGCAICKSQTSQWNKDWHVDHDHSNGVVRGILCHKCNLLVGLANNDPAILNSAAYYLKGPNYRPPDIVAALAGIR